MSLYSSIIGEITDLATIPSRTLVWACTVVGQQYPAKMTRTQAKLKSESESWWVTPAIYFFQIYDGLKPKDRNDKALDFRWPDSYNQWWECKFLSEGIIDQGKAQKQVKRKSLSRASWLIRPVFIPGFRGRKWLRMFLFPWIGCQSIAGYSPVFADTHLYSWVERGKWSWASSQRMQCMASSWIQSHNPPVTNTRGVQYRLENLPHRKFLISNSCFCQQYLMKRRALKV